MFDHLGLCVCVRVCVCISMQANRGTRVWQFWREMQERGMAPREPATYNVLMSACEVCVYVRKCVRVCVSL